MPSPIDLRNFITRYATAVSNHDIDGLLALFTDDAVQCDPASSPPNIGKQKIREFFEGMTSASSTTKFVPVSIHTCGNAVAIDFHITVTVNPEVTGTKGTMEIKGIEVFQITEDERISSVSAYYDDNDVVLV